MDYTFDDVLNEIGKVKRNDKKDISRNIKDSTLIQIINQFKFLTKKNKHQDNKKNAPYLLKSLFVLSNYISENNYFNNTKFTNEDLYTYGVVTRNHNIMQNDLDNNVALFNNELLAYLRTTTIEIFSSSFIYLIDSYKVDSYILKTGIPEKVRFLLNNLTSTSDELKDLSRDIIHLIKIKNANENYKINYDNGIEYFKSIDLSSYYFIYFFKKCISKFTESMDYLILDTDYKYVIELMRCFSLSILLLSYQDNFLYESLSNQANEIDKNNDIINNKKDMIKRLFLKYSNNGHMSSFRIINSFKNTNLLYPFNISENETKQFLSTDLSDLLYSILTLNILILNKQKIE